MHYTCTVVSRKYAPFSAARFHSQSRTGGGGAYSRDENTCAGTLAENGRGVYTRGECGHYSIFLILYHCIFLLSQAFWWYGYNASWYVDDHPPAVRPGSASLEGKTRGEVSGE